MSVKLRLARLEAKQPPDPFKPQPTFLWCSDADNAAIAEAEARAAAGGQELFVIRLVAPELDANGRAIRT